MGLLEPPRYGEQFHQLFMAKFEDRRNTPTKGVKMRKKKTDKKVKENMPAEAPLTPSSALVEFEANASKFAVFSAIRSVILEAEAKYFFTKESDKKSIGQACCPYCSSNCRIGEGTAPECRCHQYPMKVPADGDSDVESEFEESTEKEVTQKVPQIVGAGLKSLFELIAEARNVHPTLCTKALKALFDVIQGQFPESFKSEPSDIVDPLYELLLELATTREEKDIESWSALGCAALLGLCVARADTGKTLRAVTALLMSPKNLPDQLIQLPMVLCSLQRSIHSVTLGKPTKPNFFRNGIPKNSLIDQILLDDQFPSSIQYNSQPSIASDGKYVYILSSRNLVKIGTGFGGTFKGYIYAVNNDFIRENSSGWIGFCNNILLYKRMSKRSNENVLVVNTETLNITGSMHINFPQSKDGVGYILFSDGVALNAICTTKDDSMIVKQLYSSSDSNSFDLPLKLARKNFRTLGYSNFEEELLNQIQIQSVSHHQAHVNYNHFEPKVPTEQEVLGIVCGKEFGLVRTNSKKVYYYGKSNALGLKSVGKSPTMKMTELIVSKVPNIIQVTIGHDGVHAILLGDDGTAYFAGTARRGEDGDTSKNRRLPKASKPKKLNKVEGHFVVQVSCNNGTSAFVTKTGKLIMFGKDTTQCDSSGFVTDLLDQHITKVALGKAHCVALNSKGQLFSFGLNNKGQCGRVKEKDHTSAVMDVSESVAREPGQKLDSSAMCDYEEHNVVQGQCKVCSICRECSGYNISCVSIQSTPWSDRVPGANCSCGHGDAGCSKCGACSSCIMLQDGDDAKNSGANLNFLVRQRSKSLIMRKRDKKIEEGNQGSDAERDPPRVAPLSPQRLILPSSSPVVQIACGLHHTVVLTLAGEVYTFGSNQYGQLGTGDLQPVVGPAQIDVTGMVSQIAAGSNHTVLLTYEGVVYTFGNYQKGQLGRIPSDIQQQTVVSQKEDLNKSQGSGESSRISQKLLMQRQSFLWNCTPESVTGMGPSVGKKATWIGASGDQTFIKVDESLITGAMLSKINVVADKNTILLIPHVPLTFQCLAINRRDGSCNAHTSNQVDFAKIIEANHNAVAQFVSDKCNQNIEPQSAEPAGMSQSIYEARNQLFDLQEQKQQEAKKRKKPDRGSLEKMLPQLAFALDMGYGCLWIFDAVAKKLMCYNVIASEIQNHSEIVNFKAILSSELALPLKSEVEVTRNHASLNLLASLDILTSGHDVIPNCFERMPAQQNVPAKDAQNTEFQSVTRFENFGGGWGYSGHSVECVRFMVDSDIILCGFGMYGGRGEYTCKIKLFDLGIDGGGYEKEGILLTETEEVPFECPARSIHNIILPKSIQAAAGRWYLVWARVSGPSSDCGSSGQPTVTTEDQIVFTFKTSKKANNGTDVNSGQIPSILYRIITQETNQPTTSLDADPVHRITRMFANSVTKECFESLVTLLKWSWATFKMTLNELTDKKNQYHTLTILNRLIYINKVCLRLLRKYIGEIYPNKFIERPEKSWKKHENEGKNSTHMYVVNQGPSTSKNVLNNRIFNGSMEATTPTNNRKYAAESNQLAECIGEIRALLIQILCDDLPKDASDDGLKMITLILDECHITFVACFNSFYPTPSLKWNYLCDLFMQMEKGVLHSRLLSAILAGLCSPTVQLKSTFSLLTPSRENKSIVSPSDNSGLPMLTSSDYHQYPVLVEQMIYRTQQEKINFTNNTWTFKNILTCLLGIISYPIKSKMEMNYSRDAIFNQKIHQGLIDNCCHLLARVLAEIVYQSCVTEFDPSTLPSKSRHCTSNRFGRTDVSRTWNTGNFGPDAIAFTVDRSGIAIAGAMVYSGSGNYEYQLELLYDTMETNSQHKWEAIESVSGLYDQSNVQNEMAELKFERPVHIKENVRYAIRLCSQGARTCSGDAGLASIRGPCGTFFTFYPCDLSFNGTTPTRGQIPSLLYYSTPMKNEGHASKVLNEMHARETALQIATDITRKASEMLILARNTLAASISSSDKSPNSSNNTQTVDSEHNITPIEEHIDVAWTNNSNNPANSLSESNLSRDFTKRIESFSKGLMETLKFDKRNTNPYDFGEIEIGATEIHPNDLLKENEIQENKNFRNGKMSKINGNNRVNYDKNNLNESDTDEDISQGSLIQILEVFGLKSASMFHSLLPLVYAHIGPLANSDPKSSVRILSLIKEILPHVTALNQLYSTQDTSVAQRYEKMKPNMYQSKESTDLQKKDDVVQSSANQCTTSNHYCIVESDHPYKNATISTYRVTFPACVQWFTIEFDPQCGTAQQEDCLHVSIPARMHFNDFACNVNTATMDESREESWSSRDKFKMGKSTEITASFISTKDDNAEAMKKAQDNEEWLVIKKFSTPNQWCQKSIILPGNKVEFSLETASPYARDQQSNRYGFKCHVVGYDNPSHTKIKNSCLIRLEHELAHLGGMCTSNLMKKDLMLPDDTPTKDITGLEETLAIHSPLLTKGLALPDSALTINQALDAYLPIGAQSNERQFLKDFVTGAPGSSGARLAAWLQPEPRLDTNKCELKPIQEPIRYGWPTQLIVLTRDQYGDNVFVPDLKIEIRASPAGIISHGNKRNSKISQTEGGIPMSGGGASASSGGGNINFPPPPNVCYEATFKDKMCLKAITCMKAFERYSFEELRYSNATQTRISEILQATDLGDGTFGVLWTPNTVGGFCLTVSIDGITLEEIYRVEVKEAGIPPPPQKSSIKKSQPPNKLRKFMAKYSAGLRIRSHPTLQSEQVGIIKMNGIISFIDEIENDDGVWVRLSTESIRQHCTSGWYPTEAWCLQYNQHLGKTLLHPVVETHTPKPVINRIQHNSNSNSNSNNSTPDINEMAEQPEVLPKHGSPKKGFDFTTTKFTPPLSGESGGSGSSLLSNPFQFASNKQRPDDMEDSESKNVDSSNSTDSIMAKKRLDDDHSQIGSIKDELSRRSNLATSSQTSSNQANIGSALAGVVGGGASKLHALHKWFKGDSIEPSEPSSTQQPQPSPKKKSDFTEFASVSVKDLVKAIGGAPDAKSNGNGGTPMSRSSSPVAIPAIKHDLHSTMSSSSRSVEISDTSAFVSSLTRDLSQSPSQGSIREDPPNESSPKQSLLSDTHTSQTEKNPTAIRTSNFSLGTVLTSSSLSSPKHSPRKMRTKRAISPGLSHFGHPKEKEKTEHTSPSFDFSSLNMQEDAKSSSSGGSVDKSAPPVWPQTVFTSDVKSGPPKRALPPSLAESLRAVFAAFLWHEGLVHDAMACASFLKFYPSLPKQGALVVTRGDIGETKISMSKEQKAQQRYSVEVAYSGSDLNIRPSTLETLTKSGNSSLYRRYRKMNADGTSNSDKKPKLQSLPEVVTVMPPALRCLVFLWEQLCSNCVQFVQTSTVEVPKESPTIQSKDNAKEKCSNSENAEKDVRKGRKKKKDDGSWCELCEIYLPIPVTYHMRIIHPGCGKPAKGKGYNSVGTFCEGWAGNCGEGGKGASSWYLMCDTCREKFRSGTKNINQTDNSEYQQCIPNVKFESIFGLKSSMVINSEVYAMMKENAMFLLELAPTGSGSVNTNQKKSPQQLPLVVENHVVNPPDFNRPGTSRGAETSGGGSGGGGSNRNSRISLKSYSGIPTTSQYRKSSVLPLCISPELIWQAPEMFSCLESLGATMINELPYEIFGLSSVDNGFDRPLSDISFDSVDPERHFTTSMTHSSGGAASRFPRSYSMGQGWNANYEGYSRLNAPKIEDQSAKVVYRRRNNSPCDGDAGSLLLCYPSEHLRKLVPDSVFNSSCMQPQQAGEYHVKQQKTDFKLNERNDFKSTFTAPIDPSKVDEFQFGDLSFGASRETNENSGQNLNSQDGVKEEKRFDLDENTVSFLMRPVMSFILQRHNLDKLKHYMKRNLRVAICRIYSLQALNWLTRSVTQPVCLHDLMWWFVTSLTVSSTDGNEDGESALEHPVASTQMSGKISMVLSQSLHTFLQTVADLTLLLPAGSALQQIAIQCFGIRFKQADHQFLHRSHVFGNISKILSKSDEQNEDMLVSSAAAGQMQESNINFSFYHCGQAYNSNGASIQNLIDLGGMFELTVSSRQAMAASLTDNSTETFWESDEEDRNKSKIIEISMTKANHTCKILFVHIDNSRDIQNKVSNLMFYAGQSLGDTNLIKSLDIDTKTGSWFSAYVPDETCTHFRLEMRGPENSLRVRQVKVLGISTGPDNFPAANKLNLKSTNSVQIQQRNCETETLRVFRLITAQVFGKLILGPSNVDNIQMSYHSAGMMESSTTSLLADSLDLREHMVGILFSRSKLSHLQKQVIVHIVQAIRKEAQRAKEEWEIQNNGKNLVTQDQRSDSSSDQSRSPDTYCFEMLSMVLALSGSAVGRSYLSHQHGLLKDLLSLLHTGSDRVQRQVTALLRRILPEISPESLGDLLCVQKMPPEDFSIAHQSNGTFDMCMLGIIDIFLAIIAKSLQLQVKVKTTSGPTKNPPTLKLANCIDLNIYNLKKQPLNDNDVDQLFDFKCKNLDKESPKNLNQRWFLKGSISNKQAENIICLIRDMASGKLSDKWSLITKAAVAESILNLTRLDEIFRNPDNCIKTATLWLALASLCVLDRDHVEKLSSGQWSKTSESRPLCTNHDDGITSAVIQCNACGSLCGDCDRFLHLNRKTRNHHRTVCKEEEEAIRVELHESCGRTKLFWLLALADSKTLKGIVEFRDGSSAIVSIPANSVGRCRFCGVTGNSGLLAIGNVCADAQCQEHAANTCAKIKQCGHACGGVAHETKCLPCLQNVCHDRENQCGESFAEPKLTQDADDMCMICFVEALSCAPSIQLECGHVFHFHCCKTVLQKRWTGPRISFGFSQCPICKIDIKHLLLGEILEPIITLKTDVKRKAMMRLEYEGVIKATDHKDLASYAMDRYAYYVCFKCQKAYYGGEARCDAEIGDNYNPQELVCGGCSDVARAQMCPKHGTDFLEYKCRYCCSVAVFFCFGTTHFCDTCHDDFQRLTNIPKNKLPRCPAGPKAKQLLSEDCPLHIVHPQTGEEFALGCGICRNAQTF